jgi:hypothetical protein
MSELVSCRAVRRRKDVLSLTWIAAMLGRFGPD